MKKRKNKTPLSVKETQQLLGADDPIELRNLPIDTDTWVIGEPCRCPACQKRLGKNQTKEVKEKC